MRSETGAMAIEGFLHIVQVMRGLFDGHACSRGGIASYVKCFCVLYVVYEPIFECSIIISKALHREVNESCIELTREISPVYYVAHYSIENPQFVHSRGVM